MKLRATCLQTHNAPEMVAFYTKVFGHEPFVDGGVDFQFREEQLTVFKLDEGDGSATTGVAMVYAADDVDADYARLNALGLCNLGPPTDKPWGVRSFVVNDPDGNAVSLMKHL